MRLRRAADSAWLSLVLSSVLAIAVAVLLFGTSALAAADAARVGRLVFESPTAAVATPTTEAVSARAGALRGYDPAGELWRSSTRASGRHLATKAESGGLSRLRTMLRDERGGTAGDGSPDLIYEHNPKHGPVARQGPKGEISRAPRGGCQAMLECSTQLGPKVRSGVEPETGLEVRFRRHRAFGNTEWWHGYVPGG